MLMREIQLSAKDEATRSLWNVESGYSVPSDVFMGELKETITELAERVVLDVAGESIVLRVEIARSGT